MSFMDYSNLNYRFYNNFLPDDSKILNNPYKLLKYRMDTKQQKKVKSFMEEFVAIQNSINSSLFDLRA